MDSSSYRLAECHVPVAGSDAGKGRERLHKKPNRGRSPPELLEVAKTPNRQLCFLRLIINIQKYPHKGGWSGSKSIIVMKEIFLFILIIGL